MGLPSSGPIHRGYGHGPPPLSPGSSCKVVYVDVPSRPLASPSATSLVHPGELLSFVIQSRRLTANSVVPAFLTVNLVGDVITLGGVECRYRQGWRALSRTSRCRVVWTTSAGVSGVVRCWTARRPGSKTRCRSGRFGGRGVDAISPGGTGRLPQGSTSVSSRGWSGTGWCSWTSILLWWGWRPSRSGCTGTTGNVSAACPGLLRASGRWLGDGRRCPCR